MLTVKPENSRGSFPRFSNLLENFFESDFPAYVTNEFSRMGVPAVNIKDTKGAYHIEVSAPGFSKENFSIKAEEGILSISAEAVDVKLNDGDKYTRREFYQNSFKRSFSLPKTVVLEGISATYDNGVLLIVLPKIDEAKAKGSVEIKIS